jgi:hypothetical protein
MSRSLEIACNTCKKRLWVGQGYRTFYHGDKNVMWALGEFLFDHETTIATKHELTFQDEHSTDEWFRDDKWEQVRVDEAPNS